MTEPMPPQLPEEPQPALVRDDPIAWRWVVLTAVVALIGLVTTIVVVQHRHSGSTPTTASKPTSLQVLDAAARKTAALNTSHMVLTMTLSGHGQQFSMRFGGDISRRPAMGRLTGSLPAGLGRLEERILGHTLYLNVGGRTLSGGRHWVAMHVPNLSGAFGGGSDPLTMLKNISDASGVTEVGTATVDGAPMTQYRADIDLATVASKLPSQFRLGDPSSIQGTAMMDVYVAGDGTARKVDEHMDFGAFAMTFVATVQPIDHVGTVAAPPASDVLRVTNLSDALSLFGAGS